MASNFDTRFAANAAVGLAADFCDTDVATLTTDSGDNEVDAIVGEEVQRRIPMRGGSQVVRERSIIIQASELPSDLKVNDSATVDGTGGYAVIAIGSAESGLVEIELRRHGAQSMHSENYEFGN
jgi:hypothetical protein